MPLTRSALATLASAGLVAGLLLATAPDSQAATGTTLIGAGSGRCLDVAGDTPTPGTAVQLWDCHGRANQLWQTTSSAQWATYAGTRCLQPAAATPTSGTALQIATCATGTRQQFDLTSGALVHRASRLCAATSGGATANRTRVVLTTCTGGVSQQWRRGGTDASPPSAPGNPRVGSLTCSSVRFAWDAATDDVGVTAYDIYHDGQFMTSVAGSALATTLTVVPGARWGLYVNARDGAGNVSQGSRTVTITPPQCQVDTTPPTAPSGLVATASGTTVTLRWSAATDDVRVASYEVRRDGTAVGTVSGTGGTAPATTFTDAGLRSATTYRYTVLARDPSGNVSPASAGASVTTGAACAAAICAVTTVARDQDIPWGLVTLPDGGVLYARRDAFEIVRLDPASGAWTTLGAIPGAASTDGEGGLLGLAVASTYATDRWLYVFHTTSTDNRIVRLKVSGSTLDTSSRQVLLSGIARNKYHDGGRLRFGPDGKLYASTGDAQRADSAQDRTSLNGKVLRINPDGTIPADNPFGNAVWSYGHRNPQGLAFDSQGRLWEQEFGNSVMDETNLITKGGNYGWPDCEGTSGSCNQAGFVAPKQTYPTSAGSCSGIAIVRDVLYVACARGQRLYRAVISGTSLTSVTQWFQGTYGRLRTVEPAADGGLWLTTTNDGDSVPNNSDERIMHVTLG